MAATRKARVPMAEQIRLINECRQSGMTDADWCRENGIAVSTFYNWVNRCRKTAADQKSHVNYSELLQLAKSWGNLISDRIIIWRLRLILYYVLQKNIKLVVDRLVILLYISPFLPPTARRNPCLNEYVGTFPAPWGARKL